MPAIKSTVAPRGSELDVAPSGAIGFPVVADGLLTAMASIRRSGRLLARRPVEFSTLTGSQVELMRLVRRRPGVSVTQAAAELRLAPNTVSTLVRQLADAGLMIRAVDEQDRRVARLEVTADMAQKVIAFRDRRIAVLTAGMARLSTRDQGRLAEAVEVLSRLAERLPEQEAWDE